MYGELYQYLILHRQLNLPGIGRLCIEKKPARFDVADKVINPPAFSIALQHDNSNPPKNFFNWLALKLGISDREAVIRFNNFLFDLKKQLSAGNKLEWEGVGTISKGLAGDIILDPSLNDHSPGTPVPAVKVLRDNAQHIIRVGEDERTSAEMQEILHHTEEEGGKSYWWVAALVLVILSIIFIGYYFSVNGMSTSAAANQKKLDPAEQTKTH
jgi:hypothetical protein